MTNNKNKNNIMIKKTEKNVNKIFKNKYKLKNNCLKEKHQ